MNARSNELPSLLSQPVPDAAAEKSGVKLLRELREQLTPREKSKTCPRRAAIVGVALKGHLRLAVAVASELARRGFAVDFLLDAEGVTEELQALQREWPLFTLHAVEEGVELIKSMDWSYVASSSGRIGGSKVALMEQIAGLNTEENCAGALAQWRAMIRILERTKPDVLICDHAQRTIQLWGEDRGVPSVILHTPYFTTTDASGCAKPSWWQEKRLNRVMRTQNPLAFMESAIEALGIGADAPGSEEGIGEGVAGARKATGLSPHTFVFCEPELLNSDVRSLPDRVHVVGPCFSAEDGAVGAVDEDLKPWLDDAASQQQSVLYVALGTLANGFLNVKAVEQMLRAFQKLGSGWRVLWSLPEAQQPLLAAAGGGSEVKALRVESFVRQRAVLAHPSVRVFLTHGGQSSVNEGIFAGVPLVCMPLFCDQYEVADAVDRHGLGLVVHKDELLSFWGSGSSRLAALLHRVAEEPEFRAAIERHQKLMRLRKGCSRAAAVVESIVEGGADYQELWKGRPARAPEGGCGSGVLSCFQGLLQQV